MHKSASFPFSKLPFFIFKIFAGLDVIDAISEDEILFFIGLTAGTTVKGAYDPIDTILDIADGGCWIHIDGSWGGGVIFTDKYRSLVNGLERTDSFSIDAHKMINSFRNGVSR